MQFARDLIRRIVRDRCADPARVCATGVSNGGGMSALLGCRAADVVTGIDPIAEVVRFMSGRHR